MADRMAGLQQCVSDEWIKTMQIQDDFRRQLEKLSDDELRDIIRTGDYGSGSAAHEAEKVPLHIVFLALAITCAVLCSVAALVGYLTFKMAG